MAKKKNLLPLIELLPERLSHSYSFLVLVCSVLGLLALDWASRRNHEATLRPALPPIHGESEAAAVFKQTPWSFFHPLWSDEDPWTRFFKDQSTSALPTSSEDLSEYVDDPEGKLSKDFKVTPGMKKRVLFWVEIYAKYNSKIKVVHDRNDPGIVYGYIDLRPLYRVMGKSVAADVKANEIERKVIKEFKARLTEAIGISSTHILAPKEREEIRTFLSNTGALSPQATAELIENVRSQTGQRDEFLQALHRASTLLPHIETVFRKQNLPTELARIPFVESSFNVRARSNVGAVGIWQFMPETARQMIHPDEEMWSDPLKQTTSAAKLFKIYRSILPDWSLTVTSYNSGVGRLRTLSTKHKVKNIEALLKAQGREGLGFAGENFYSEFLAANIVEGYKEAIFKKMLGGVDLSIVFKGNAPFPKQICDL